MHPKIFQLLVDSSGHYGGDVSDFKVDSRSVDPKAYGIFVTKMLLGTWNTTYPTSSIIPKTSAARLGTQQSLVGRASLTSRIDVVQSVSGQMQVFLHARDISIAWLRFDVSLAVYAMTELDSDLLRADTSRYFVKNDKHAKARTSQSTLQTKRLSSADMPRGYHRINSANRTSNPILNREN